MNCRRLVATGLLFLLTFISTSAAADSPIDKEAALEQSFDQLVRQAQQAFDAEDYEAATEYLVIANQIRSDPRLYINIARSYEEAGDCVGMLAYYSAFLENPTDEEVLIDRAQSSIDDNIEDCEGFDESLSGRVVFVSEPALARIYLDGEYLGLTPSETVGLAPGPYEVRLEKEGYEDYTTTIDVESLSPLELSATLREEVEEEEPDGPDEPTIVDDSGFSPHPLAIGLAGVGVGGLLAGAYVDLFRLPSIDSDIEDAHAAGDHGRVDELRDSRRGWAYGAAGFYIVGGLFTALGGGWLIYDLYTSGDDAQDAPFGWQITPSVHTEGAGLNLLRRF